MSPLSVSSQRLWRLLGAAVFGALAVLAAGLLFAVFYRSGVWLLPGFGLLGIVILLQSFPWPPLLALLLFTGFFARLQPRLPLGRGKPLWLRYLTLLILAVLAGFLLSRTPLYGWRPPPAPGEHPAARLLSGYGAWRLHNVFVGTATSVSEREIAMTGFDDEPLRIELTDKTTFPFGREFGSGDTLLVIGELRSEGIIRAFGVRELPEPRFKR